MLYHEWILEQMKAEKPCPEERQLSFNFGPNVTQCAHCGDLVHSADVVIKTYHTSYRSDQEHFCSDECHHEWYVKRLRQWGM